MNVEAAYYPYILKFGVLGVLFYDGRALKKDDFKAQFWFDKAAAQGDGHAVEALSLFKN